jgi:RNA polymerase sigma-70 factor (ECF subfamily)
MTNQAAAIEMGSRTRPSEREHEQFLVQRACNGDSEAFGQLYEQLVDRIYRYIYFRVTDEDAAQDLTSKVFLKAWEHLPRFKHGNSPFIAWLYTIAHNTLIDHYRTNKPSAHLEEISTLPAPDPLPDQSYDHSYEAQSLRLALQKLTDMQRDVVTMKLIDGMSTEEIARRLRKSPGAIRALQMRALQALAAILQQEEAAAELVEKMI